MLKEAISKNPNSFDLQWRTARALGIWADQINMRNTLENAIKANPKNVDGILAAEKEMSLNSARRFHHSAERQGDMLKKRSA